MVQLVQVRFDDKAKMLFEESYEMYGVIISEETYVTWQLYGRHTLLIDEFMKDMKIQAKRGEKEMETNKYGDV